jgi:hypothetical protein
MNSLLVDSLDIYLYKCVYLIYWLHFFVDVNVKGEQLLSVNKYERWCKKYKKICDPFLLAAD